DVDRVAAQGDHILELPTVLQVAEGQRIFTDDAAGFAHADLRCGVEQPAVLETRQILAEEFQKRMDLLPALDLSRGEIVDIRTVAPEHARGVDAPHAWLQRLVHADALARDVESTLRRRLGDDR